MHVLVVLVRGILVLCSLVLCVPHARPLSPASHSLPPPILAVLTAQGLEETIKVVAKGAAKGSASSDSDGEDGTYAPGSPEAGTFFLETLKELKKGFLVKKPADQWPSVRDQMHKVAHQLLQERREDVLALNSYEGKEGL
jgi:hypothetical protein